jgi:predicted DNA-binding transcriptional regulator YafY
MTTDKLTTLIYLHELIAKKATGSPAKLAKALDISERTAYNYLHELKKMGAPIAYCHSSESYAYTKDWKFCLLNYLWQCRK